LRKQVPGGGLIKNPPKVLAVCEAAKMVEAVLPSLMVQRSWSLGPQRMCQELRRVVQQLDQKVEATRLFMLTFVGKSTKGTNFGNSKT
jgi:hypothetical protein